MVEKRFSLSKSERLKSRNIIKSLFESGESIFLFPFRLVYLKLNENNDKQLLFAVSVPKRKFKKASERNHLKRLIREVYRVHKPQIPDTNEAVTGSYALMYIYVGDSDPSYDFLKRKMKKLNRIWADQITSMNMDK